MADEYYGITLVCARCGKKVEMAVSQPPQFSFELV